MYELHLQNSKMYIHVADVGSGNFSIRFWRQYVLLFSSMAAIVSLLLTSDRKISSDLLLDLMPIKGVVALYEVTFYRKPKIFL